MPATDLKFSHMCGLGLATNLPPLFCVDFPKVSREKQGSKLHERKVFILQSG